MPEASAFDDLVREFFAVWFRFHPDAALRAGVGDYAALLPAQTDDEQAALAGYLATLIVALQELDFDALDRARRIDLELLVAMARAEHRELLERDWRHRDPMRFLPLAEIHRLTLLGPSDLRDTLAALLTAIPGHLRLAQAQLQPMAELVPPVLADAAVTAAEEGRRYLRALTRSRWLRSRCHSCGELEVLAETAGEALAQYRDALLGDIAPRAAGSAGCGADHLQLLLRHRHLLDMDPVACESLLDALADDCDALLGAGADQAPGASSRALSRVARDALNNACQAMAERLRQADLVTLPPAALRIAGGPVSPRPGDGRVDYVPDLRKGAGFLYLADGDNGCEPALTRAAMSLRCLHLGWGGAHLLAFAGGMAARSLPRRLSAGHSLTGGWSLYLDRRLFDQPDTVADERAAALHRRRQAVARARTDLALNCGWIDAETAVERIQQCISTGDNAGREAIRQVAALVQHPGDALAAVLGWQLIEAAAARNAPGGRRLFHDRLLGLGPIPISVALRQSLGAAEWSAVHAAAGVAGADEGPLTS